MQRLILACLLLILVACSSTTIGTTPTATPAAEAGTRTLLMLWHAWPQPEARSLAGLVERFNRATPGVQVRLQSRPATTLRTDLATAVAEGGGPHMVILPNHLLGALADEGILLPLDDLLTTAELARLLPTALGAAQVASPTGMRLYGLPLSFDTLALYYNRANFTGAPPAHTEALLTTARGLTDATGDPPLWGLAYNLSLDRTIGYLYAFDGRIFDEEGQLVLGLDGHSGTEAWLTWLLSLREDPRLLASLDGVTVDNALRTRRAVMTIDWAHAAPAYAAIWPESIGVAPLPRLTSDGQAPRPYVQSDVLALNARLGQAEREAVLALARYLMSEPAQRELLRAGRQPVLLSLNLAEDDPVLSAAQREAAAVFRAQAEAGLPMPNSRLANEVVWGVLTDMHTSALRRLLTPAQAVEAADMTLRARLASP